MKTLPLLLTATLALGACRTDPGDPGPQAAAGPADASAPTDAALPPSHVPGSWREFQRPTDEELRAMLSPLAYRVTQEDGTERAFTSELNDNKAAGLYVDVVSGEPLFSSRDKFDSGTGWPSFTRPIRDDALARATDYKIGYARTEVRSAVADSHLGHVFPDGPEPTGLRYCINGAALRFVPVEELEEAGYGELAPLFE